MDNRGNLAKNTIRIVSNCYNFNSGVSINTSELNNCELYKSHIGYQPSYIYTINGGGSLNQCIHLVLKCQDK